MTKRQSKAEIINLKGLLTGDQEYLRKMVETIVQATLEAEMTEAVGAEKSERTPGRVSYRSGYYSRGLITRVGTLELRVPQDRRGRFSTELFERYQRAEKALVVAPAEMYVQGVSTRKVKAVTEDLCGHSFSASTVSGVVKKLDASLKAFAERRLNEPYPYAIFDARYERVREDGVISNQALLIAVAVDWEGRRQVIGVELANRESRSSWKDFLLGLKARGLHGSSSSSPTTTPASRRRLRRFYRRPHGSDAMSISSGMRSTTFHAKLTMIVYRNCAGSMTDAISPRPAATLLSGWPSGKPSTAGFVPGSRTISKRR